MIVGMEASMAIILYLRGFLLGPDTLSSNPSSARRNSYTADSILTFVSKNSRILVANKLNRGAHTIAATPRVLVIVPSPANPTTLLNDNEVVAFVLLDEVDSHAHS